jgi:hypothetical protein
MYFFLIQEALFSAPATWPTQYLLSSCIIRQNKNFFQNSKFVSGILPDLGPQVASKIGKKGLVAEIDKRDIIYLYIRYVCFVYKHLEVLF